jgi:hypothetical protein
VVAARTRSHMSILPGRDREGRRLHRRAPDFSRGGAFSETSDAAVTIELNNLVGLDVCTKA